MEGLVLGLLCIGFCFYENKPGIILKRLTSLLIGFAPALATFFLFLQKNSSEINVPEYYFWQYVSDQVQNAALSYLGYFDLPFCILLTAILLLFIGFSIFFRFRKKKVYRLDILIVLFLIFGVLLYFAPDDFAGGSFIFMRLALYSNILAFLFIAIYPYPAKWASISGKCFFAYALIFLVIRSYFFFITDQGLNEYRSIGKYIPEGKTFLPLVVDNVHHLPGGLRRYGEVEVYLHASSYISIERNAVCLENYEASYNYFPLHWKNNQNASTFFPENGDTLKDSSIAAFANSSGHWPDYILLWGEPDSIAQKHYLLSEINRHYSLNAKSANSYAWLYRKK
jgi:hypothetical protein